MGETVYSFLVTLFGQSEHHMSADLTVSMGLTNIGMFVAYMWLTGTLLWFTTQSMLLRRTPLLYLFAAFISLCGIGHLGHVVGYPEWLTLIVDFLSATVSLYTALIMFQKRHFIISAVFQFKYIVGLLKTIERLDDSPPSE